MSSKRPSTSLPIHYRDLTGVDELYDLVNDPYEMKNVINEAHAKLAEMQARLARLKDA
jgi:hypothetical protein